MKCEQCGKELSGQQKRFCSTACWYESRHWNRGGVCAVCGKPFTKTYRGHICCCKDCGNRYKSADREQLCPICGKTFERPHGKTRTYCSRTCAMTGRYRLGQIGAHPEGGTIDHSSGYVQQKRFGKWVMQHRLVIEDALGRKLEKHEHVHHKNGDRKDNRPENLELWQGAGKKDPSGVRVIDAARSLFNRLSAADRATLLTEFKE